MHRTSRIPAVFATIIASLGCGAASTPPPAPAALPAPSGQASAPEAAARHPSADVAKRWPFDQRPDLVVYADAEGLFRTELFQGLVPGLLAVAKTSASGAQAACIRDAVSSAREILAGANDALGSVIVVRFDASSMKSTPGACLKALGDVESTRVEGAKEAYRVARAVIAVEPGLLVIGEKAASVSAAFAGRGRAETMGDVDLRGDEYVTLRLAIPEERITARGSLNASNERFRIGADVEFPDERAARELEAEGSALRAFPASALGGGKGREAEALQRLTEALSLTRKGKRINIAFELREAPVEQAADLGMAAALATFGVRRYLTSAKTAEAKNTVGAIAKDLVAWSEAEEPTPGKAKAKKKLFSLPPVPKAVPRGTKYQSSEADWKAWQKIHFTMTTPQLYQYEVKAAPDGKTADVIARGDLNGDGKTSLFKLVVKLDGDHAVVAPNMEEQNPDE